MLIWELNSVDHKKIYHFKKLFALVMITVFSAVSENGNGKINKFSQT